MHGKLPYIHEINTSWLTMENSFAFATVMSTLKVLSSKNLGGSKMIPMIGFPLRMWRWTLFCYNIELSSCILQKSISCQYFPKKLELEDE
jgi:hypothetical protein